MAAPAPQRLSRIAFGWLFGSTFGCACAIFPSGPITYVMRLANPALAASAVPYAVPIARSVSQRSGNG